MDSFPAGFFISFNCPTEHPDLTCARCAVKICKKSSNVRLYNNDWQSLTRLEKSEILDARRRRREYGNEDGKLQCPQCRHEPSDNDANEFYRQARDTSYWQNQEYPPNSNGGGIRKKSKQTKKTKKSKKRKQTKKLKKRKQTKKSKHTRRKN